MTEEHWSQSFRAFSPTHAVVVITFVLLAWLAAWMGRCCRDGGRQHRIERIIGWMMLAGWIITNLYYLLPHKFDPRHSWPLHMCDLAGLLAPLTLLNPGRRSVRTLLHFWGLALCTQAFITPLVRHGPASPEFWMFWSLHASIVGTAAYDIAVRGYRPTWRDCGLAMLTGVAYAVVIFILNEIFGWNYAYLGRTTPDKPTVLDGLGPWPSRAFKIVAMAGIGMMLLMLPWEIARRLRRPSQGQPGAPSAG